MDQWDEAGHRRLMRLLVASGRPDLALAQFETCCRLLEGELGIQPGEETVALYETILAERPLASAPEQPLAGEPPFKGLSYFDETDAALFYGREALTAHLLSRVRDCLLPDYDRPRVITVIGASGSGKSSIVRAGLVPAVREPALATCDGMTHPFRDAILVLTPTATPLEVLAAGLRRIAGSVLPATALVNDLASDGQALHLAALGITGYGDSGAHLLLVIDQFEELFTLCRDVSARRAFIDNIIHAATVPGPVVVVLALRADFYSQCAPFDNLRQALTECQIYIGSMSPEELRRAIEEPAQRAGWTFEPGLVDMLLNEVGQSPGALPLLSHALLETWRRREGCNLTLAGYEASGGVAGALAQSAETLYGQFSPQEKQAVRDIFLRLIEPGDLGEESLPEFNTRRRAALAELLHHPDDAELVQGVINRLSVARLITIGLDTVEVTHEALIREWPRLRGWVDEDRAALRQSRRLTQAAAEWEAAGRTEGFLLRGARLDALAALTGSHVTLTEAERDFLAASIEARQARRRAEIETARKLAETERQRADEQAAHARGLRQRAALLAGALALAVLLAVAALLLGRQANANADARATASAVAEEQRDIAVAKEREALESVSLSLAANARQALEAGDQPLALLLALAANEIDNPPLIAWRTLLDVAYAPGAVREYEAGSPVQGVDISPDGRTLITGSDDGMLRLWDIASGELLKTLDGETDSIREVAFSPNGQTALAGSNDGSLILWDMATGQVRRRLPRQTFPISAIAFLPDGRHALTGMDSEITTGMTLLWELETGEIARRYGPDVRERIQAVRSIAVDPAGRTALVGYANQTPDVGPEGGFYTAILYDIETGEVVFTLEAGNRSMNSTAITADGRMGLGASDNSTIFIWNLVSGETLHILEGHEGVVNAIAVSADGRSAFSGASDGVAIEWNLETGQIIGRFTDPSGAITSVAYRDGTTAVTGSLGGTERLWDLSGQWLAARWRDPLQPPGAGVQFLEISPDGLRAVSAPGVVIDPSLYNWSATDTERVLERSLQLVLWDYETGTILRRYDVAGVPANEAAFMPDGKQVLLALEDATLVLFDLESGQIVKRLIGHWVPVKTVDISADGRYALSGSSTELIYWDLTTGQPLYNMNACFVLGFVNDAVFLPGDRLALANNEDGTIVLWDLTTGEQIHRFSGLTGNVGGHIAGAGYLSTRVNELAVTRDGRQFLSTGLDNDLLLWDTATARSLRRFQAHAQGVFTVALTPDDHWALSGAGDESLILWDVATAEPIHRYIFPAYHGYNFVPSIAMHPGGETALVNDPGGSLVKWRITEPAPAELMDWLAQSRIMRELTCSERATYRITPLCVMGRSAETTADMLSNARHATAGLVIDRHRVPADGEPIELRAPERTPKVAVLGENRGELVRGDFDVWTYEGQAGEILSIQMVADRPVTDWTLPLEERYAAGVLDTAVQVVMPDKTIADYSGDDYAADDSRVSDAYLRAIRLRVDGTYRIEARSALDDQAGPYTLIIKRLPDYWDQELMEKATGTYLHLPWNIPSHVYILNGHLLNTFPGSFGSEDLVPISETEFFGQSGNPGRIVRDENGVAVKFDFLEAYKWNDGPYWYEAIRIGDLPPDFEPPLSALNLYK